MKKLDILYGIEYINRMGKVPKTMSSTILNLSLLILTIITMSCSTIRTKADQHTSEQAFLKWYTSGHFTEAANFTYQFWRRPANANRIKSSGPVNTGDIRLWHIDTWVKEPTLLLALSRDHATCEEHRAWLIILPEGIWVPLVSDLFYDLCAIPKIGKYSNMRETAFTLYWCEDTIKPIIEIRTKGSDCTRHYLYVWSKDDNTYRYYGKKCGG